MDAIKYSYEHGYADGVEEGKRLGVIEALKPYDVESVEDLVRNVRNKTIDEVIALARAEIDFESQAEQARFVEFMKGLKEKKHEEGTQRRN